MSDQENEEKFALTIVGAVVGAIVIGSVLFAARSTQGGAESAAPTAVVASASDAKQTALGALGFALANGKMTLSGEVADEKAKSSLLKPATLLWGAGNVVDKLTVKADAPKFWWNTKPIDVLSKLKGYSAFDLKLNGNDLTGTATVANEADKATLESGLKTWFTNDAHVAANINVDSKAGAATAGDASVLLNMALEFATGSAAIPENAKAALGDVAEVLKDDGRKIHVSGHTDNVGKPESNKALSQQRADSVKAYLVSKGVPADNLIAEGFGEEKPVADNATPEGRQRNRRIAFSQ